MLKDYAERVRPRKHPPMSAHETGIQSLQQRMVVDEDIMKIITSLLQDPDFQKILEDEAFMEAISAGDINALKSNPKLQKLLNKSAVKQIEKQLEP